MLRVKAVEARYLKDSDHDIFNKMDPYVIFELAGKKYQTQAHQEAGTHPVWNEEFTINTKQMKDNTLLIDTWDDDTFKDDFIGSAKVNLDQWMGQPKAAKSEQINLYVKGKVAGQMIIEYFYDPSPQGHVNFAL